MTLFNLSNAYVFVVSTREVIMGSQKNITLKYPDNSRFSVSFLKQFYDPKIKKNFNYSLVELNICLEILNMVTKATYFIK